MLSLFQRKMLLLVILKYGCFYCHFYYYTIQYIHIYYSFFQTSTSTNKTSTTRLTLAEQIAAAAAAKKAAKRNSTYELDENDDSLIRQEQDAFNFSMLRAKLECRLQGKPSDSMDEQANMENEIQKQQAMESLKSRLGDTGNVQRAKNKWLNMEKSVHEDQL